MTMTETVLGVTSQAAAKIKEVAEEQGTPDAALRVIVTGGGCSGFQYLMTLEDRPHDDDTIVEQDGVKVVIDPQSAPYLVGATIDYLDGLMKSGFTIDNPNAQSGCACGSSSDAGDGCGSPSGCGGH